MKTKLFIAIATILTFGITSCNKDSASGSGSANVNYQINTINRTFTVPNSSATISWVAGYANLTKIEFEAESTTTHIEYETKTSQKLDLFTSVSTKAEFETKFGKSSVADAFQLSGKFNTTPIIFKVTEDGEYEADAELANVTIAPNKTYSAIVTIDFSKLTSGISADDFNNAIKDNAGVIIISVNTNGSLYGIMKNNLQKLVANVDFH